eukprot:13153-Heterococcus_DN1.PRE.1
MRATLLLVALSGASAFSTCPPLSRRHTPGPLCSCPSGDIPPGQEQPKSFADSRKQAAGSSAAPKASPAAPPTKWGHTDRIDVHPESWALGNGNFADSYLQSQARTGAQAIAGESPMAVGRALVMSRTEQDRRQEAEDRQLRQAASTAKRSSSSSSSSTPAANTRTAAAAAATTTPLQPQPAAASAAAATAQSQTSSSSSSGSSKPATAARTVVLDSETLGVGGMEHVVDAIRRRVWIPLSAPRSLLDDLGVSPVSGLLLHGPPGCGKSLLARRLSALLTPRAPTFVSGPEILDRFVGSSEANVRSLFDYPPPLPAGAAVNDDEALHVIVLDEFDAIAGHRSAGGGGDGGERVRDSVVNQLLSRMDGVQQMTTPTLLVALTNRIDLIDPALLRPGRFEVHIECGVYSITCFWSVTACMLADTDTDTDNCAYTVMTPQL